MVKCCHNPFELITRPLYSFGFWIIVRWWWIQLAKVRNLLVLKSTWIFRGRDLFQLHTSRREPGSSLADVVLIYLRDHWCSMVFSLWFLIAYFLVSTNQYFVVTPALEKLPTKAEGSYQGMKGVVIPFRTPIQYF